MKPASSSQATTSSPAAYRGDAGVIGVGKDGADDFFGVAALTKKSLRLRLDVRGRRRGRYWASVRNRNRGEGGKAQVSSSAPFLRA